MSSKEKWGNDFTLTKTEAKFNNTTLKWEKITNNPDMVRFMSPIRFKIIKSDNNFQIFIHFDLSSLKAIEDTVLWIENDAEGFPLLIPNDFDYDAFFDYIINKVEINDRFIINGDHKDFSMMKNTIIGIFNQLKNNLSL